jgi:hypothetical protein
MHASRKQEVGLLCQEWNASWTSTVPYLDANYLLEATMREFPHADLVIVHAA